MESNARRRVSLAAAAVVAGMTVGLAGGAAARADVLFSENFDGLTLGPFVSPTESGGTGADWTATPPAGWTQDNSQVPVGNPVEFYGFTFLNKASWVATEGNQNRSDFTKGTNTVMVADGDAFDDGTDVDPGAFNPRITTPPISLANVEPGSLKLSFSSSFRPYDTQTANVEVSFDGGNSFQNILQYTAANSGGDSSLTRVDEDVTLDAANPAGAAFAQFRFGMADAGNDWWWAIDNVSVTGNVLAPEPSSAALLGLGLAALLNKRKR